MQPDRADAHLRDVLRLCGFMLELADRGDEHRQDAGCGVVFGTLRDAAYRIARLAEQELDEHAGSTGGPPSRHRSPQPERRHKAE